MKTARVPENRGNGCDKLRESDDRIGLYMALVYHGDIVHVKPREYWRLQTDAGGKRHAFTRRFLRVKLYTHRSDRCAVNERVVETDIYQGIPCQAYR